MKEAVLLSRSLILLQAGLILAVIFMLKCCLSRWPANAANACGGWGWGNHWSAVCIKGGSRTSPSISFLTCFSPNMGHWEVSIIKCVMNLHPYTSAKGVHTHTCSAAVARVWRPPEVLKHAELQIFLSPKSSTTQLRHRTAWKMHRGE